MATLQHGTRTIGYAVEGPDDGIPVLLFHGTTMSRTAWDMVRPQMTGAFRFVMVEFPGSGESSMPDGPLEVGALVDEAIAVLDHLGIERFHVAGYSLGGVVALATAASRADRIASCTSLCGWATTDARMRLTFRLWRRLISTDANLFMHYAVADGFTAAGIATFEPMIDGIIAMGATSIAPGSDAHLDLDERVDISSMLPSITAPTLLIAGGEDRWVDPSHSVAMGDVIDGAVVEVLPFGHLVIQEGAAQVAALLGAHVTAAS
jgi:pimeloyl-ACP methyl ester carboxylesterase